MYGLLRFLLKNIAFITFIFLEIFCFILIVNFNENQRNVYLDSAGKVGGYILSKQNAVSSFFAQKAENRKLVERLEDLEQKLNQVNNIYVIDTTEVLDSSDHQFEYIHAKVISNSISKRKNLLVLDKGSSDGIEIGMGVVSSGYVIGIVKDVRENYAQVISILNENTEISASIPDKGVFGVVNWVPFDTRIVNLKEIPRHIELEEGLDVVTSGYSLVFPYGMKIGKISSFELNKEALEYQITVELGNSPYGVHYVQVLKLLENPEFE